MSYPHLTITNARGRMTEVRNVVRAFGVKNPLTLAAATLIVGLVVGLILG